MVKKIIIKTMTAVIIFLAMFFCMKSMDEKIIMTNSKVFLQDDFFAPERKIENPVEEEKICYLTFDDGPSENTIKILDILKEYDAKATFFVIGNSISEKTKPILERIIKEGHAIGLHANNHVYEKFYADETSYLEDYKTLYKTLKHEYGIETALFRLPG